VNILFIRLFGVGWIVTWVREKDFKHIIIQVSIIFSDVKGGRGAL